MIKDNNNTYDASNILNQYMMRVLESIITLSDPEGDKEQDENTDAPTDKVSA